MLKKFSLQSIGALKCGPHLIGCDTTEFTYIHHVPHRRSQGHYGGQKSPPQESKTGRAAKTESNGYTGTERHLRPLDAFHGLLVRPECWIYCVLIRIIVWLVLIDWLIVFFLPSCMVNKVEYICGRGWPHAPVYPRIPPRFRSWISALYQLASLEKHALCV